MNKKYGKTIIISAIIFLLLIASFSNGNALITNNSTNESYEDGVLITSIMAEKPLDNMDITVEGSLINKLLINIIYKPSRFWNGPIGLGVINFLLQVGVPLMPGSYTITIDYYNTGSTGPSSNLYYYTTFENETGSYDISINSPHKIIATTGIGVWTGADNIDESFGVVNVDKNEEDLYCIFTLMFPCKTLDIEYY